MEKYEHNENVINHYEPHSAMRTATGVLASLFSMGLPIGLTELLRAGGDLKVAMWAGVCTLIAVILAFFSIRGTLKE